MRDLSVQSKYINARKSVAGFTLIEMLVAVAILAILAAVAAPSFRSLMNSSRLTTAANDVVAMLQIARMEAVRSGTPTIVCSANADSTACNGDGTWTGWIVGSAKSDGTLDTVIRAGEFPADVLVSNSDTIDGAALLFRPDGVAKKGGALVDAGFGVCMKTTNPDKNQRSVWLASGSRISVTSSKNDGCGTAIGSKE